MLRLILCVIFSFSLLGAATAQPKAELKVLSWSDYIDPELLKKFEAETGHPVHVDVYEETEAMLAKLQSGAAQSGAYDIVIASDHTIPVLVKLNLLQKLDAAKLPNIKNVDPRFATPPYDPKSTYSQPYQWGTVGILYNRKKLGEIKPSWSALFDPAQKGKFLLIDSPRDTLGVALKAGGKSVNTTDIPSLQAAGRLVQAAKKSPNFVGFDGSVSAAKKVISGQADLALVYNGDALNNIKEAESPSDFDYFVPVEGSIIWVDTMILPVGTKNPEAAHKFLNFILDADHGAQLSNYINFATPNRESMPSITETARKDVRIYPTEETIKTLEYLSDVGPATKTYDTIWTAIKAR